MNALFSGRLGLAQSRIPYKDRHGLIWLSKGKLYVKDGTLHFAAAGNEQIEAGIYAIPYQGLSMVLMGPGTTISHDALRILARHGTLLAAVGEGGVKFYTAPPMGMGRSEIARAHALLWANKKKRVDVARRMYALRFGRIFPHKDITVLRGIEGSRIKELYKITAEKYGIKWEGRRYDRQNPEAADLPNQAINHAATFVEAAAHIAVAAVGALPPLGFIHEDPSISFVLDIADLWRADLTIPLAFSCTKKVAANIDLDLERTIRLEAASWFRKKQVIPKMIDTIKELLNVNDTGNNP